MASQHVGELALASRGARLLLRLLRETSRAANGGNTAAEYPRRPGHQHPAGNVCDMIQARPGALPLFADWTLRGLVDVLTGVSVGRRFPRFGNRFLLTLVPGLVRDPRSRSTPGRTNNFGRSSPGGGNP
jgi:hypothetical protein